MAATIAYCCPFVPREWIAAHGLAPMRVLPPATAGSSVQEGVCPFMAAFMATVRGQVDCAGVIMTTVCDQMRRGSECMGTDLDVPVFLMNVPSTCESVAAHRLYAEEVRRLGQFLERRGGTSPQSEALAQSMTDADTARRALDDVRADVSGRAYAEALAALNRTDSFETPSPSEQPPSAARVALLGGPLLAEQFELYDRIEANGGRVVLDGTETGERTLPRPFDRRRLAADPFFELCDAYFGSIPDVARRPNTWLYTWLRDALTQRQVEGVVLVRQLWCDLWHAETARLRDWLDVPLLDLELADHGLDAGSTTRIEAFLEMLA